MNVAIPTDPRWRQSSGFTLIEVLLAIVLSSMIAAVVVAALFTSVNVADTSTAQINDSTDVGLMSAFLYRDAQSAGGIDPSTALPDRAPVSKVDNAGCGDAAHLKVRFRWTDRTSNPPVAVVVTYGFDPATKAVTRTMCKDTASPVEVVLARYVTDVKVDCEPDTACAGRPAVVKLTITGSSAGESFKSTLQAPLRTAASQLTVVAPSELAQGQVAVEYPQTAFGVIGGAAPLTWAPTEVSGLQLSSAGVLSGSPTSAGTFSFDATVTDADGVGAVKSFTLTVRPQLAVSATLPAGTVGVAYPSTQVVATGGTAPYVWTPTELLPGLSIGSDGVVSGTPMAAGEFPVTITVTDAMSGVATWNGTVTITVAEYCPWPETKWTGEYFGSNNLSNLKFTRQDDTIAFDWGTASPDPRITNKDNFSVRWTKSTMLDTGTYTFRLDNDDYARLYIDGVQVINNWNNRRASTYTALLTGWHTLKVEFRDLSGAARVSLTGDTSPAPVNLVQNNGVAVTTDTNGDGYYGEDQVILDNRADQIKALSVTIRVAKTSGVSFKSTWQDLPAARIVVSNSEACGYILYTLSLKPGQVLDKSAESMVVAQWDGSGTEHPTAGDTWTVTSTTAKGTTTVSGNF